MKDKKFRKDMTPEQYLAYLKRQAKNPDKFCDANSSDNLSE